MTQTAAYLAEAPAPAAAKAEIAAFARALGFEAVGFAGADQSRDVAAGLSGFIAAGLHGEMDWLARTAERRAYAFAIAFLRRPLRFWILRA